MNQNINTVLLPIKPEYTEKILDGSKKYEYRKIIPKRKINSFIIYSSSPIMQIVGFAIIDDILCGQPLDIWRDTMYFSGIKKDKYLKYFENSKKAYAIKIRDSYKFRNPIKIEKIKSIIKIPQLFSYLKLNELKKIIGKDNYFEYNNSIELDAVFCHGSC